MTDSLTGASGSLEAPTMVTSAGGAPVMAIIEQLSGTRCRMRSVNAFDLAVPVEFNVVIHGAAPIAISGRISRREQSGARFNYEVTLDTTPSEAAAIAHAVDIARARRGAHAADVPTANGLTRAAVRIPVALDVSYTVGGGESRTGRATNISTGGLLMNAADELAVGAALELRFVLGTVPLSVRGRIVAHQEASPNYNIAFYDVRDVARETLAQFVNEHQK